VKRGYVALQNDKKVVYISFQIIIYWACLSEFMREAMLEPSKNHYFELQSLVIVIAWKRVTGLPLFFPTEVWSNLRVSK